MFGLIERKILITVARIEKNRRACVFIREVRVHSKVNVERSIYSI